MKWLFEKTLKDPKIIEEVERILNIKFPTDYKKIIIAHNAGMPSPNTIDTNRQEGKAFGELLNFNLDAEENILSLYKEIKNKLPYNVYPISIDPGGNFLCFDYRGHDNPTVVRWDHEQKFEIVGNNLIIPDHEQQCDSYYIDFVADSFTDALTKLYGEEEAEKKIDEIIWEDFLPVERLKNFDDEILAQVNKRLAKKGLPLIKK